MKHQEGQQDQRSAGSGVCDAPCAQDLKASQAIYVLLLMKLCGKVIGCEGHNKVGQARSDACSALASSNSAFRIRERSRSRSRSFKRYDFNETLLGEVVSE